VKEAKGPVIRTGAERKISKLPSQPTPPPPQQGKNKLANELIEQQSN